MSYSVDWIEAVYDRDYTDVLRVELSPTTERNKGAYNAEDLNRIENNTKYVAEYMLDIGIVNTPIVQSYKTNWVETDIVTAGNMDRIISNVKQLMGLSNPKIANDLEAIASGVTQMGYILANAIEKNLDVMHTQPPYEPDEYLLEIEHGVIYGYNNPGYVIEDDTVNIIAYPYGENAQFMTFEHWSGNTDDLQYVGDVNAQNTTFKMPDHDVKLTAVFKVNIPFMLTLTNATINDSTGGTSRLILAGTTVDILADTAPTGKRFYCWEGTEEALDLLVSGKYASTNTFTMPEKNVELYPKYINAGQHSVTVTDTDGQTIISQEWYDYEEYVSISAPSKGAKYKFTSWSGDTSYLTDITSSYQAFNMGDVNLRFTPSYSYIYGYHYVVANENCKANDETQLDNVMESSRVNLSLTSDYSSSLDDNNWFDGYAIYKITDYTIDENTGEITILEKEHQYDIKDGEIAYFSMPDYDVYVEPFDNAPSILNVVNRNNSGETEINKNLGGRYIELSTNYTVGNYVFLGWYRNDNLITTNTYLKYYYSYETGVDTVEAKYEYRNYHIITVKNKNNAGETETIQVLDGFEASVTTQDVVGANILSKWLFDGEESVMQEGKTTWKAKVYNDFEIELVYRPRETFTVEIEDGTIQDYGNSYTGLERSVITITANTPANKKYFSGWSTTEGSVYKYGHTLNSTTTLELGRSNATVKANYGDLYDLTVNTNDGVALQGQYKSGTKITLPNSTMPDSDTEWDKWTVTSGVMSIVNTFLMKSEAYTGNEDTIVNATYKDIPYYTLKILNGTFENGATTVSVIRNSNVLITMNPAPDGQAFLIWDVASGTANIQTPRAEQTYITNVTANATVQATYYTPEDETKYTLSITNKNGATNITNHSIGEQVDIVADSPDDGYEFYRWSGDTTYIENRYSAETNVLMPGKNIQLYMVYRRTGYTTLYDVTLIGGTMLVGMNNETEIWESDGQFEEGAVVQIKANPIESGYKFNGWRNDTDDGASMSTVDNLMGTQTYLTVRDFDIELTGRTIRIDRNELKVVDGETSGEYTENTPVQIYFTKKNTDTEKYIFTEWTGDTDLELFTGGSFDIHTAGTEDEPQTIKMPNQNTEIVANYNTKYKISLSNGKFEDTTTLKWLEENDEVTIIADTIENKTFSYWLCSINGIITNIYNSTTTIKVPNAGLTVTAIYTNKNEQNGIGYVLTSLYDNDIINLENINIISGEIDTGFIISDSMGHLYVVTNYDATTANILRLTQRWEVE